LIGDAAEFLQPLPALSGDDAELGHVGAKGIDELRALTHQLIAHSVLHQSALLLRRLDRNEAHGRPPNRLADRLGIGRIVLVAFDVGLYVLGRHQPNLVAKFSQLACPIMRRGTRFHAHQTRRQRREERYHLAAPRDPNRSC
jgi:hypothetical protein